ncbi:hypothetical protein QBC46DRAFT_355935 [Diplogelasinospora grovesii]|uniref:Uncharacterized protein n=1 Tax=Diplogelasinospora grovesii TaxID=303347 RepID=A0AAN6S388_9PEZI|nr:hypothetical protein QBC46DRAFT_355935 [Diplogelasinospora grovesii]
MANARTETGLARAKLLASARSTLHPEIWWMVVEELSESHDFDGLFLCARLNRRMAHMALRRLYGIYDLSPACNLQICYLKGDKFEKSACLWRSLVLSSVGETLYPYCCWIKSLKLTSFDRLFAGPPVTCRSSRARFLSSHIGKYLSSAKDRDNYYTENFDRLKRDITTEVVDKVINYIKAASDHGDTVSTLYSLQAPWFSSASLMTWAPSLSQLTSLTVDDGTVLNSDVAQAFRENCPALKEVHYCEFQRTNDLQMAGFLRGLAPNTLESFGVVRESLDFRHSIGIESLKALTEHASSLKRLGFYLPQAALESLVVLSDCVSIESLTLAHEPPTQDFPHGSWGNTLQGHMSRSERILSWLRRCTHLKELKFTEIPDFGVPELLECPERPSDKFDHQVQ